MFKFIAFGAVATSVSNFTMDGNIVAHTTERDIDSQNFVEARGMIAICSRPEENKCSGLKITKNIAAGGAYAGFVMPASNCGDDSKYRDNVAHSIDGYKGGVGAVIFPDPSEPA